MSIEITPEEKERMYNFAAWRAYVYYYRMNKYYGTEHETKRMCEMVATERMKQLEEKCSEHGRTLSESILDELMLLIPKHFPKEIPPFDLSKDLPDIVHYTLCMGRPFKLPDLTAKWYVYYENEHKYQLNETPENKINRDLSWKDAINDVIPIVKDNAYELEHEIQVYINQIIFEKRIAEEIEKDKKKAEKKAKKEAEKKAKKAEPVVLRRSARIAARNVK